jgi:hypothetical protein
MATKKAVQAAGNGTETLSARLPSKVKRDFKSAAAQAGKSLEEATKEAVEDWIERHPLKRGA